MVSLVKFLPILFATVITASASAEDPAMAAMTFIEKVRNNQVNLESGGDTAISSHTTTDKKAEIARRLERLAGDLLESRLEVGPVKQDHDLAAVLIRKIDGYNPQKMQVISVALIMQGERWLPAPLPSSFENSGSSYTRETRERQKSMEEWMLREQAIDLNTLRDTISQRVQEEIRQQFQDDKPELWDVERVGKEFIEAARTKNIPLLLGLLGGLSSTPPDDWAERVNAVESAFQEGTEISKPWNLIASPRTARAMIRHEEKLGRGMFSLLTFTSLTGRDRRDPPDQILYFELSKLPEGTWRIDPPPSFLSLQKQTAQSWDGEDTNPLESSFTSLWRSAFPATPRETPAALTEALLDALSSPDLSSIYPYCDFPEDSILAQQSTEAASRIWDISNDPKALRQLVALATHQDGEKAASLIQVLNPKSPGEFTSRVLYFRKTSDGWLWLPGNDPALTQQFSGWVGDQNQHWRKEALTHLMKDVTVLAKLPTDSVSEEAAKKCTEDWLKSLRSDSLTEILRHIAILGDPRSAETSLQNIGYDIQSIRKLDHTPEVSGIYGSGIWKAASSRLGEGKRESLPFYPIVATPQGPKILVEIDLFAHPSRSAMLNRLALERVKKSWGDDASEELSTLFSDYQKSVRPPEK